MSASAHIHTVIDPDIKAQAAADLAKMGLTISSAIRIFLTTVAREHALPFSTWRPNQETIDAMNEELAHSRKFNTVEELMTDLNADD